MPEVDEGKVIGTLVEMADRRMDNRARRRAPARKKTTVAALVLALLVPLGAVAEPAVAGAAPAVDSSTTSTTVAADAPTSTAPTAPTAPRVTAADPAPSTTIAPAQTATADVAPDGSNTIAYAGAPWFRPDVPYTGNFPDPTVVWDGTKYWAYATSTGGSLMPAMSSTDLVTWTPRSAYRPNPYNSDPFFNDAFPVPPSWTRFGSSRSGNAQWAPGVVKLAGQWVAYTSWEVAPGRRCISVARSASAGGPFVDNSGSPLVCDVDPGGSIDPAPFVDTNGQAYLLWKATGIPGSVPTKIKSRALSADGLSFAPGSPEVSILQTELPWEGNSIENPSMVRHNGIYWLIYSGNEWETANYRTGQAVCVGPLGPCHRTSDRPIIGNTGSEWSPGGGALFVDQVGRLRMIYQIWNAPYTSYPTDPSCDAPGSCTSQGQRYYRIDGLVNAGGVLTVDPVGSLDLAVASPGAVSIGGWALDPSSPSSIAVHIYIDNIGTAISASGARPDLSVAYPGLGTAHGFSAVIPAAPGAHTLCAYGINTGAGVNSPLGCRAIFVPGTSPFGSFDVATGRPEAVTVGGWAIDADTSGPISVHVYVDNIGTAISASSSRPDVAALYPASGAGHGFSATLPAVSGFHNVCAYAINVGPGATTGLGCKVVLVPGGSPFGSLDGATGVSGGVAVGGWAIDPDIVGPTDVHVYVDDRGLATTANASRPDVGAAFPGYGAAHGFNAMVPAPAGAHTVCAYAINVRYGGTTVLGCRSVVVPETSPFGSLDAVTPGTRQISVAGWAIDPDTSSPISVHVYVDAVGTALVANLARADVGAVYPGSGPNHGFGVTVNATAGVHNVCAYGINVAGGANALLGCRVVVVP